jgi:hypothetical protein
MNVRTNAFFEINCPRCNGTGKYDANRRCSSCTGNGVFTLHTAIRQLAFLYQLIDDRGPAYLSMVPYQMKVRQALEKFLRQYPAEVRRALEDLCDDSEAGQDEMQGYHRAVREVLNELALPTPTAAPQTTTKANALAELIRAADVVVQQVGDRPIPQHQYRKEITLVSIFDLAKALVPFRNEAGPFA